MSFHTPSSRDRSPSIALAMIVLNEEKYLEKCLMSVKDVVSEIIIVDTGSSDNSKAIAANFGAKIFDFKWTDSFSDARNFALSKAHADWILHLDADEVLLTNKKSDFTFLKNNKYFSYLMNIKDTAKTENRSLARLFRNLDEIRYEGHIHEHLTYGSLAESATSRLIGSSKLAILHSGYEKTQISSKDKSKRNLLLLEKALAKDAENISLIFHLSQEYANMGDLRTAEIYFRQAFEHRDVRLLPVIMRNLVVCLGLQGKFAEAIESAEKAEVIMPEYTEITFRKGIYQYLTNNFSDASKSFSVCLERGEPAQDLPSTPGGSTTLSKFFLGLCKYRLGEEVIAEEIISHVVPKISIDPDAISFISELYLQIYSPDKAKHEILKIADLRDPGVKQVLTNIF